MRNHLQLDPVIPTEILILLLIVGAVIFIWDLLQRRSSNLKRDAGINEKSEVLAVRGSSEHPSRDYYSPTLNLLCRPHAVVKEEGFIIPIEVNPLSKKIMDRHVIQLVADMRVIEELEGSRPPYGILIMGPEARAVKIKNSEEKQQWLERILQEMAAIAAGATAIAEPAFFKCKSCDVREVCRFSVYRPENDRSLRSSPQEIPPPDSEQ